MLLPLLFAFLAGFAVILGFWPVRLDNRPSLQLRVDDPLTGLTPPAGVENKKKEPLDYLLMITSKLALFNRPLAISPMGQRMYRDLRKAKSRLTVEEFFFIKEALIVVAILLVF